MTFITTQERRIPPAGRPDSAIAIIGEAAGAEEHNQLRPFVGMAGGVLDTCLHAAGLIRAECYITNVIRVKPSKNDIAPYFVKPMNGPGWFTPAGLDWVEELWEDLAKNQHNVLVPVGNCALSALTGLSNITKYRGYFIAVPEKIGWKTPSGWTYLTPPAALIGRKVLPTIHPAATLERAGQGSIAGKRNPAILRYLIAADLRKAKDFSGTRELMRPERNIRIVTRFEEAIDVIDYYEHYEGVTAFDIEVLNYCLSCFSIADSGDSVTSIGVYDTMSEIQEVKLYQALQRYLLSPYPKIMQNGIFDTHFLRQEYGLETYGITDPAIYKDTMIAHHVIYPDMPKSLAFLGSLYGGTQEYWKDMAKFKNIKEES
jgi:uracil-DNA glycosylase family 4